MQPTRRAADAIGQRRVGASFTGEQSEKGIVGGHRLKIKASRVVWFRPALTDQLRFDRHRTVIVCWMTHALASSQPRGSGVAPAAARTIASVRVNVPRHLHKVPRHKAAASPRSSRRSPETLEGVTRSHYNRDDARDGTDLHTRALDPDLSRLLRYTMKQRITDALSSEIAGDDGGPRPAPGTHGGFYASTAAAMRVFSAARAVRALAPTNRRANHPREGGRWRHHGPDATPTAGSPARSRHASIASNIATRRSPFVVVASAKTASLSARSVRNRLGGLVS